MAVPGLPIPSSDLDRQHGFETGTTLRKTGVASRYLTRDETASQLAARACGEALARSGIAWDEVECLVAASATMDQALPYKAAMIHAELGLLQHRTATFDIGARCMSFLTALDLCSTLVDAGRFRRVMIVSSDISTFTTDRSELKTNGIFGDGAAACLIAPAEDGESAVLASAITTFSEGVEFCQIKSGGSRFHRRVPGSNSEALFEMNPGPLYALIARELPGFVDRLLHRAGVTLADIDLMVPHQASHLALKHVTRMLGIDPAKVVDIFPHHGNQVAASLPTALHHGLTDPALPRGSKLLLLGSGAGVTLGGMVMIY